jgi:NADPH2:quinone reductase
MRALLCRQLNDFEGLKVGEAPSPECGPGQVRIGVKAAGVNFPDILMVEGKYQVRPPLPFVPGLEAAGVVLECGAGVTHVKPGDRVFAFLRTAGGFASEVVVPGDIAVPFPAEMDFVTAAAFPIAYGTSHFALEYRGRLKAGETLLVLGATGGVGLTAIECGKLLGARVIAAASSPEKLKIAKEYGADEVIDYRAESLKDRVRELTGGKGVDVVFDPVGGDAFDQSIRCIGWEGRILVIGFASGKVGAPPANHILVKNFSVIGVVWGEHTFRYPKSEAERFARLLKHWQAGQLKPRVWKTFPLEDANKAFQAIRDRQVVGKMVLTV